MPWRATSDFCSYCVSFRALGLPRWAPSTSRSLAISTRARSARLPIVGWARELEGYIYAVGMCGQGYMLGPGVGCLLTRMIQGELTPEDEETLQELSPHREFGAEEKLK